VDSRTTLVGADRRARLTGKALTIGTLVVLLSVLYFVLISTLAPLLDTSAMPLGHVVVTVFVAMLVVPLRNRLAVGFNRLLHRQWQTSQVMLRDIGAKLSHTLTPEGLAFILLEDLPLRLRVQGARLWMLEPPDERAFVMVSASGPGQGQPLLGNGVIARRLANASYLIIPTTDPDLDWTPLTSQGVRLVLPLRVGNQLIGIYGCGPSLRGQFYPERVINVLLMLAPAVSSALENARAYSKIARLNYELRELDQLKAEFIQSVGHELRTPLTTLSLAIQLYDRQASMTPALADITRTGIAQLQALVDRVLAFDLGLAPPAAEQSPPIMPVRVLPLLEEIIESYQPIASAKGVYFDIHVSPELTGVAHIPSLGRALHEVVDNAVRYSEGGQVTLAAHLHDGHVLLSISDEGPGIPYEERNRLFEAFYRGSGARALSATPGTGLGLSIARRDIEALGGRIWLEESSPHGSTICVAIPAASLDDVPVYEGLRERLVNA
jgi:signal transduction histidine kinase